MLSIGEFMRGADLLIIFCCFFSEKILIFLVRLLVYIICFAWQNRSSSEKRYISANASETDQVEPYLLYLRWNVSGRTMSVHLTGRSLVWYNRLLVGPHLQCLGTFGSFYWMFSSMLDFAAKVGESAGLLKFCIHFFTPRNPQLDYRGVFVF